MGMYNTDSSIAAFAHSSFQVLLKTYEDEHSLSHFCFRLLFERNGRFTYQRKIQF